MVIKKGDIYFINFSPSTASELAHVHPAVVLQDTRINATKINTVVIVGITSNMKLSRIKGNVVLNKGLVRGLKKDSVVNVSQIFTIDKTRLGAQVGSLPESYMKEIFQGLDWLFGRFD